MGHSVTIEIISPWEKAYDFLKQPLNLGSWALGCQNVEATDKENIYTGISIFTKEKGYFKIESDRNHRLIDFFVGTESLLVPRISLRIIPGVNYGRSNSICLVTLDAWRDIDMSDERWRQLCVAHETEILLIKALIEKGQ
jgi:hypothetical protein